MGLGWCAVKTPSMRRYIFRYLLVITLLTALFYTVLTNTYLYKGVEEEAFYDMELRATLFELDYQRDPQTPLPRLWLTESFLGLENLPQKYIDEFPMSEYGHLKRFSSGFDVAVDEDFHQMLTYQLHDGRFFFLVKTYPGEFEALVDYPELEFLFLLAFPIGIGFVLFMLLAVRYMLRTLYRPVGKLNHWARNLSPEALGQPLPDFGFREVNQLAEQLHGSLSDLSRALEREQRFLRNASHELRTPVAVIQSNVELLEKIHPHAGQLEEKVRARIRRSGSSMSHLIETLLWLAKDKARAPEMTDLRLDELTREIIEDNRYLLAGKAGVTLEVDLETVPIHAVAHGVRMAVGNLVRNAFQYTQEGAVDICVRPHYIQVVNVNQGELGTDESGCDYGHGIGLTLVGQIAEKAGWAYENQSIPGGRRARLEFSEPARVGESEDQ